MASRKPMDEWKRRARAAAALADIDYKDLAPKLGFSLSTLDRQLENRATRRGRRIAEGVARDVAQECGLPYEFFTADFGLLEANTAADQLDRVKAALDRTREAAERAHLNAGDAALAATRAAPGRQQSTEGRSRPARSQGTSRGRAP